jgi:hypothetical protein
MRELISLPMPDRFIGAFMKVQIAQQALALRD